MKGWVHEPMLVTGSRGLEQVQCIDPKPYHSLQQLQTNFAVCWQVMLRRELNRQYYLKERSPTVPMDITYWRRDWVENIFPAEDLYEKEGQLLVNVPRSELPDDPFHNVRGFEATYRKLYEATQYIEYPFRVYSTKRHKLFKTFEEARQYACSIRGKINYYEQTVFYKCR